MDEDEGGDRRDHLQAGHDNVLVALQQDIRLGRVLQLAATVCTLARLPGVHVCGEVHVLRFAP